MNDLPAREPANSRAALAELLGRTAQADGAAFAELYSATSAKLMGVCVRILRDTAESEEVLQEVFIAVWRRAGDFDADRGVGPMTWLTSIARYRAIDRLRARRPVSLTALDEAALDVVDQTPGAEAQLSAKQTAARLDACLKELEPNVQAAIRTAFFEGITYDTLAQRMGQPAGTVKSWIRRGLMKLRLCLER